MTAVPDLSVVVLCYKAEDYIIDFVQQVITELNNIPVNYEIILVANYDTQFDSTPARARHLEASYRQIRAVTRPKEGKMGWDMRTGLREAKGNYIAIIDGDGQMPASDLMIVYHIIKKGNYDLVKTYRAVRNDGRLRKILSKTYNLLFSILFNPSFPIRDINSKPKIMSRKAYNQLKLQSNDWFTDSEIMIQAFSNKMRICEVSTTFYKNEHRKSFIGIKTICEFIFNLFYYRLKKN